MARQIIKQPSGLYAVWSTNCDDFLMTDATPEEIIDQWTNECRIENRAKVIGTVAKLERGEKPYCQFTLSWEQAVARAAENKRAAEAE